MAGYPAAHCHVVTTVVEKDEALVLVHVGTTRERWFDGIRCRRESGGWCEVQDYTCSGGFTIVDDDDLGFMVSWGEVPSEVDAVRLDFDGATIEVGITEQVYLFANWHAPRSAEFPYVTQYRVKGEWIPAARNLRRP